MSATAAFGMTFNVETFDLRPLHGITHQVYATGEIVPGDTERLLQAVQLAKTAAGQEIFINLHSPGGSIV
jgi:hypothetical protein